MHEEEPLVELHVFQILGPAASVNAGLVVRECGGGMAEVLVHDYDNELHQFLEIDQTFRVAEVSASDPVWGAAAALAETEAKFQAPYFEELSEYRSRGHMLSTGADDEDEGDEDEEDEVDEGPADLILFDPQWSFWGCTRFEAEILLLCWGTFGGGSRYGHRLLQRKRAVLERLFRRRGTLLRAGLLESVFFHEKRVERRRRQSDFFTGLLAPEGRGRRGLWKEASAFRRPFSEAMVMTLLYDWALDQLEGKAGIVETREFLYHVIAGWGKAVTERILRGEDPRCSAVRQALTEVVRQPYRIGARSFITGMGQRWHNDFVRWIRGQLPAFVPGD